MAQLHDIAPPEYLYHGTNHFNAKDIAYDKLRTHRPWYGTNQRVWPDGSAEKRSYWTEVEAVADSFYPKEGKPTILRVPGRLKSGGRPLFKRESTGDWYSTIPIPAKYIQIKISGSWVNTIAYHDSI